MIIANHARIIQKGGHIGEYTHIVEFKTDHEFFYITGETDDVTGGRVNVFDKFRHADLIDITIEPRTPI